MRDINELMKSMEKFMNDHNISISESEKECFEHMLEDLRQIGYDEGYDDGYSSGYDEGYDFGTMSAD